MDPANNASGEKKHSRPYRGRFAPSPTGRLHLGSLFTAVASYLRAKSQHGQWFVRIDDLDRTRACSHSVESILHDLEKMGLYWDESERLYFQSHHLQDYEDALNRLIKQTKIYPCTCTRHQIQKQSADRHIYPGTCKNKKFTTHLSHALRIEVPNNEISFEDRLQGDFNQNLSQSVGDFVLRRKDGFYAYQLAVVVDDEHQQITEVVRGSDLLDNTPRQIWLQRVLGYTTPDYLHVPVLMRTDKNKISKSTPETVVEMNNPKKLAIKILQLLNQPIAEDLLDGSLEEIWREATVHFNIERLPRSPIVIPT